MNLYLQVLIYVVIVFTTFGLFVVAGQDLTDEKSETSTFTKFLELITVVAILSLWTAGLITGLIKLIEWITP